MSESPTPPGWDPAGQGGGSPPPGPPPAPPSPEAASFGAQVPPGPPGSSPGYVYQPPYVSPPNAPGAVPALVLGIVGLALCGLCAPFAWVQGQKAERAIQASGGAYAGGGMATTGKILGIVGTVFLILSMLFGIVYVVFLIVVAGSS